MSGLTGGCFQFPMLFFQMVKQPRHPEWVIGMIQCAAQPGEFSGRMHAQCQSHVQAQFPQCDRTIAVLTAFGAISCLNAGGAMAKPDGGGRFVAVLAAVSGSFGEGHDASRCQFPVIQPEEGVAVAGGIIHRGTSGE